MMTKRLSLASALLIAGTFTLAAKPPVHTVTVADEARVTLKDFDATASALGSNADLLRTYINAANMDADSHLDQLETIKAEINKMGKELASLEAQRSSLSTWEQQAVDKSLPLLKNVAANTESAIHYFNANRNILWTPVYRGYADAIYQDSEKISKTVGDYLKYAKAQTVEQKMEGTLGMGTN